jgi:TolB-like protein
LIDSGPLSSSSAVDLVLQLVAGVAVAHGRGIIHRDLKPENVFVTSEGRVKILDFGLAKTALLPEDATDTAAGPTSTREGTLMGTLGYMSPEQLRGRDVDHRSDIFAIGAILYELLSARRAFHGDSAADTLSAILNDRPADLTATHGTPSALARVVGRCLEKKSADRFQSAQDLRSALESLDDPEKATPRPAPKSHEKSIAVLPFANISADPENQYFSDGLSEELINALTRLRGLRVASRTSAFRFRGRDVDVHQIGHDLHVDAVLEGSVRRAGSRIRITAQLSSVADGYHIWSERYDRELSDVFAIQDEIVESIVDALAPTLVGHARACALLSRSARIGLRAERPPRRSAAAAARIGRARQPRRVRGAVCAVVHPRRHRQRGASRRRARGMS